MKLFFATLVGLLLSVSALAQSLEQEGRKAENKEADITKKGRQIVARSFLISCENLDDYLFYNKTVASGLFHNLSDEAIGRSIDYDASNGYFLTYRRNKNYVDWEESKALPKKYEFNSDTNILYVKLGNSPVEQVRCNVMSGDKGRL